MLITRGPLRSGHCSCIQASYLPARRAVAASVLDTCRREPGLSYRPQSSVATANLL